MKNKIFAIIILIAVTCIAWFVVLTSGSSDEDRVEALEQKIEANKDVRTYKNNLAIYSELIEIEPENVEWYLGLADTYVALEQYGNYKKQCEAIVEKFPNEDIGYIRLIKYYSEMGKSADVISVYKSAPEEVKINPEFKSVYEEYEWKYVFVSSGYSSVGAYTNGCYVVENQGMYGLKNKNLSNEVKRFYSMARPYIDSFAAVYSNNEWYFIDGEGDRVLATKTKIEDMHSFSQGYAVAKIDGKYGFIDKEFNRYYFDYEDATCFYNGVAAVKKDGKWALINTSFKELTDFIFDDVVRDDANICSRKGVIFMLRDDEYYMLNLSEGKFLDVKFEEARPFYSDYAAVKKGDKWGFIDKNGNNLIDYIYDDASSFNSGIAAVKKGDKWGCVDVNGKELLGFEYDYTSVTADNGVVVLKIGEIYRFIKFIKFN